MNHRGQAGNVNREHSKQKLKGDRRWDGRQQKWNNFDQICSLPYAKYLSIICLQFYKTQLH